ncbi:hypothetical protein FQR65_LT15331 [Abscondita terminalis]|nr:hypothetical protein FQR65_LT15331 [Abscondita terminalis]
MLDQIASPRTKWISTYKSSGDLEVDEPHTIEDTAIALGGIFPLALGNQLRNRTLWLYPTLGRLSGAGSDRFWRKKLAEMFYHFFKSFTDGARANLNIKAEGKNEHHKIEAIFKAFAKAIKSAVKRDPEKMILPSTKGML